MSDARRPVGWRGPAAAGVLTGAMIAALSWPAIRAPDRWVVGASHNDASGILWGLDHTAQHLAAGSLPPLVTNMVLYPEGAALRVADLPEAILLAPLTLSLGAVAAFNLLTLLHHALGAAAGWWCGRRIGASPGGASVVAAACGFAPVLNATTFNQNPDVTAWYWIPLTVGLAWQARGWRPIMGAALCAGAAGLCNPYGGVMAATAFFVLTPLRPLRSWLIGTTTLVAGLATSWCVYGIPASMDGSATAKVARDNLVHGVATPLDLLQPWPTILQQDSTWSAAVVAHFSYLGISLIVLGLAGLVRRRAWRWLALLTAALMLALGPAWPPYAAVEALTPLGQLHLSHRFTFLAVLTLAVGAARWLSGRAAWLALAVILTDLIWTSGPALFRPVAPFDDGACALLAELPEGPIFDLPGERGEQWLYAATCHGRPVAAGLNRAMSSELETQLRTTPVDERADLLVKAGFRYLVHHGRSRRTELGRWPGLVGLVRHCTVAENRQGVRVMQLNCPKR